MPVPCLKHFSSILLCCLCHREFPFWVLSFYIVLCEFNQSSGICGGGAHLTEMRGQNKISLHKIWIHFNLEPQRFYDRSKHDWSRTHFMPAYLAGFAEDSTSFSCSELFLQTLQHFCEYYCIAAHTESTKCGVALVIIWLQASL